MSNDDSPTFHPVSLRLPNMLREPLARAQAEHMRNMSTQILYYVREGLRRDGFIDDETDETDEAAA